MSALATGFTLRPMTLADVPAAHAIETRLFPVDAWSEGLFQSELTQDTRTYLVAADDAGSIVGYAGIMAIGTVADLQTIAVDEAWQGRGVGSALLRALIDDAIARGCVEMFLEVRSDNPAQAVYEHYGFVRIDIRRDYYARGIDALVMRKSDLRDLPAQRRRAVVEAADVSSATLREPADASARQPAAGEVRR